MSKKSNCRVQLRTVHYRKSALFTGALFMYLTAQAFGISITAQTPELIFENSDFECGDLRNWTPAGNAFTVQPVKGDNSALRNKPAGPQGTYWIGTYECYNGITGTPGDVQGDGKTGTLTSVNFTISKPFINYLIGAGAIPEKCTVEIWVDEQLFHSETGRDAESLTPSSVDVSSCTGKTAYIVIRDEAAVSWGHINADWFTASQTPLLAAHSFSKELQITGKYLLIPVKTTAGTTTTNGQILQLASGTNVVREFRVLLSENGQTSSWISGYPVDEFAGKTVTIRSQQKLLDRYSEAAEAIAVSDEIPDTKNDYIQPYRDQFHFSVRRGWNNDINGLVYNAGVYHLYYQYNPFNICWDNMHWGHAVSTDLVHWVEQDITLFQNSMKDMMFSGGGFMDPRNSAGVSSNGITPQFIAFTSTGRGECIAYSMDGGNRFTEIPENPVVKHRGRDPKVIWHEPTQKWIMAVYDQTDEIMDPPPLSGTGDRYLKNSVAFYSSLNLRSWTFESRFVHPDRKAIHECPELFEIAVEGKPEETRYILYGVENRYFIGWFDGNKFTVESGPFAGETGRARAAQMISNVHGGRHIQLAWALSGVYPVFWPDQIFSQGVMIPKEVTLHQTSDGLRLFFYPVKETDALHSRTLVDLKNPSVAEADQALKACAGKLLDVIIEYQLGDGSVLTMNVNGPGIASKGSGSIRILSDRTITELFVNGGEQVMGVRRKEQDFYDSTTGVRLSGAGTITRMSVFEMKSIW